MCLHAERDYCIRALGNQLRVDQCDCKRLRVQIAHASVARNKANTSADSASSTTPLTRTTQSRCGKPRAVTTDAAKVKQVELWQLEKCGLRIKAWEAREIQLEVRVSAKRECLPKLEARLKHGRIDDDAEDERNEEGLRDCLFPQYYANLGVSPLMRRTEREVRRDSCDKVHKVFTEGDDYPRAVCHCFIQNNSTAGFANQCASHVWQLRAVSFFGPKMFVLRLWSGAIQARTVHLRWMLDDDWN